MGSTNTLGNPSPTPGKAQTRLCERESLVEALAAGGVGVDLPGGGTVSSQRVSECVGAGVMDVARSRVSIAIVLLSRGAFTSGAMQRGARGFTRVDNPAKQQYASP